MLESRATMRWLSTKAVFPIVVLAAATLALAAPAAAQDQAPVYQEPKKLRFTLEALARYEWTQDIFVTATTDPRREPLRVLGLPGPRGQPRQVPARGRRGLLLERREELRPHHRRPQRDNFHSRDARLDRAFAKFETSWLRLEARAVHHAHRLHRDDLGQGAEAAGRRPAPGGAGPRQPEELRGDRRSTRRAATCSRTRPRCSPVSAEAMFAAGMDGSAQLVGSYVEFRNLDTVQPFLRRQNSRATPNGLIGREYKVVDGVVRVRRGGRPARAARRQLLLEHGGGHRQHRASGWRPRWARSARRARDSTTPTRRSTRTRPWASTRPTTSSGRPAGKATAADLGFRLDGRGRASLHGIAQWQRFKDSPREAERDDWQKRFRVELRIAN